MKKLLALLLAFALILALAACGETETPPAEPTEAPETAPPAPEETPEEEFPEIPEPPVPPAPEEAFLGEWYGVLRVVSFCLDLRADGSYLLSIPSAPEESVEGTWALNDGFICLDGDETAPLSVVGEGLYWPLTEVVFTRAEPAAVYTPAALRSNTAFGDMDGYWVCTFVDLDGEIWPAELFGENTDLYIEGQRAALGGDLFGDILVNLVFEDGVLSFADGSDSLRLALQEDGMLRLVLSDEAGEAMVLYLSPLGPIVL